MRDGQRSPIGSSGEQARSSSAEAGSPRREGVPESLHVDLVVNDFAAQEQRRVAILHSVAGDVKAELFSEDEVIDLPPVVYSQEFGREVDCREPAAYLGALSGIWHGTVFAATSLHDSATCPYADRSALPFEPYSGSRTVGASSNGSVAGS